MAEEQATIAVVIPCHNEAATIAAVVDDFRSALPDARIYVFDNCCTDDTAEIARQHGATVLVEPRKGKGFVVEGILDRIDAEYCVMVDGDDTYPADRVGDLLAPLRDGQADMVVGARLADSTAGAFRALHAGGNRLVVRLINWIFSSRLTDVLSGYRAFNRRFAARVPVVSSGFEVETEMTMHALYHHLHVVEVQVPYRSRPPGSESKLRTFGDGFRVLWKIVSLLRAFKPLTFFGSVGLVLFGLGLLAGIPPVYGFIRTGRVDRFPLAILATGLMLLSAGNVFLGVLLHALNWRLRELHSILTRGRGEQRD